uniref:Putative membrane protein n=1 Tax=Amblyomma triste TaxID=251400 RepID=A0A023G6D8_AMBTT
MSRPSSSNPATATAAAANAKKAAPAPTKAATARVPAARDAKLSKDSTNMQLAGTRKVDASSRTTATKTAAGSNAKSAAAGAKAAPPTSKYSTVRAVPKVGAAKKAVAAAAAEDKSKSEPSANHNGTPEEKGTLEEKDNKEVSPVESEAITMSSGSHVECDEAAKSAAVAADDLAAAVSVADA